MSDYSSGSPPVKKGAVQPGRVFPVADVLDESPPVAETLAEPIAETEPVQSRDGQEQEEAPSAKMQSAQFDSPAELPVDHPTVQQPLNCQDQIGAPGPSDSDGQDDKLEKAAPSRGVESLSSKKERPPYIRIHGISGDIKGRVWSFQEAIRIGRCSSSEICLDDSSVSRRHAVIWNTGSSWRLVDLASTNGTFRNGIRVGDTGVKPLGARDIIQFGKVAFVIESMADPAIEDSSEKSELQTSSAGSSGHWNKNSGGTEFTLGPIRVGAPTQYKSIVVFPLFAENDSPVEYLLADEAVNMGVASVGEVSVEGNVAKLIVVNRSDTRVLFLEGEELRGSKQNRVLNTSLLVPARSSVEIPVSCVERNRWDQNCDSSSPSLTMSTSDLRFTLKSSVYRALGKYGNHCSDQDSVWNDVKTQQEALGVRSSTESMADTFSKFEDQISEARRALPYVEGSYGLAVAIGPQIVSVDLLDKPSTCQKVWHRLLPGLLIEEMMAGRAPGSLEVADVETLLNEARFADWEQTRTVGEGQEFRTEFDGKAASTLRLDGQLVHFSLVARIALRR
jgi:pSer/pThr/pTyr-binding forkhead associated (FHA) protein